MSDTCTACGAPDHADTVRLTDEGFCAAGLSYADAYAQLQKMFRPDPWPMESDTLREREDYTDAEWAAVPAGAHFLMGGRECTKLGDIDPGWSVYANANTLRAKAEAAEAKLFRLEMRCPTCGSDKFGGDGDTRIKCHGHCEQESTYAKWEAHAVCVLRSGVDVDAVLQAALREVVQECAGIAKVEEAKCEAEAKQWHERHDYEMEHGASEAACAASAIADAIRAHYGLKGME